MLEGAGRWKQMWYSTLPSILPIVMVTLVLRMGDLLDVGVEKTLLLSNAMNRSVAEVFDSYVYERGVWLYGHNPFPVPFLCHADQSKMRVGSG